ncbi:hypothetical protein MUK42_14829 [Musa troglodytarum]|uniref:Uncharacterized protein n=1 Tax=Musa troglodytarum TaxID=320322 RepID=A0A9E7I2K3_9LILI|nr:hypothetical protein MUK42_14829 [Musa troglodytarum]
MNVDSGNVCCQISWWDTNKERTGTGGFRAGQRLQRGRALGHLRRSGHRKISAHSLQLLEQGVLIGLRHPYDNCAEPWNSCDTFSPRKAKYYEQENVTVDIWVLYIKIS